MSDLALKEFAENGKATKRLNLAYLSLKSALAEQLLPIFTAQADSTAKLVAWINKLTKNTNVLKAGVIVIGAAMAWQGRQALIAGAKTALAYAPVVLVVAGLILLLDDLITFFKGGDSAIGAFIDKIFDPKTEHRSSSFSWTICRRRGGSFGKTLTSKPATRVRGS